MEESYLFHKQSSPQKEASTGMSPVANSMSRGEADVSNTRFQNFQAQSFRSYKSKTPGNVAEVSCVACALPLFSSEASPDGRCYSCQLNSSNLGSGITLGTCPKNDCWLPAKPGFFCDVHGNKKEVCQTRGCSKQAAYRTIHCKGHGGGKRCSQDGCEKSAQDGGLPFCSMHGGGKRCKEENCKKGARGLSGRCQSHGGGIKCLAEDCTKPGREATKLCREHEQVQLHSLLEAHPSQTEAEIQAEIRPKEKETAPGATAKVAKENKAKSPVKASAQVESSVSTSSKTKPVSKPVSKTVSKKRKVDMGAVVDEETVQCLFSGCGGVLEKGTSFCVSHQLESRVSRPTDPDEHTEV